jgi:hypothetical protein
LKAKLDCLDAGLPTTTVNHAKFAGCSRLALWKLRRRYPWLDEWCDEVMRAGNTHRWASIEHRMANLAEQGSVAHADQYCRMTSGHYGPALGAGEPAPGTGVGTFTLNLLVPRPEMPAAATPARHEVPLPSPGRLADIPVVNVRGTTS